MPDVIVIGAGLSGLTCAWHLRRSGIDVLVLEAAGRAGGVVATHAVDGYLVESGPNTILPTPASMEIIAAAGLEDEMVAAPPASPRFVYANGRLRRVPWVLSPRGTARALGEVFVRRRAAAGEESLASFFVRRFGPEAHDRLAAPFVGGIYAGDTRELSLESTFPRLSELERRYGSVIAGALRERRRGPRPRLASFRRGMAALPAALEGGLEIRCGSGRFDLPHHGRIEIGSDTFRPGAVVLAVPAAAAAGLLARADARLAELLGAVAYAPIVVAALSLDDAQLPRPLDGFGFLVARGEDAGVLGALYSSSLFAGRAPSGKNLLTAFLGGALAPEVVDWTGRRLWDAVGAGVGRVLGTRGDIAPLRLFRHRRGIPQYRLGHAAWRARLAAHLGALPGLFLTGNYLEGVSVPAAMEHGRRTAESVIAYLRRES